MQKENYEEQLIKYENLIYNMIQELDFYSIFLKILKKKKKILSLKQK